ncbi:MAG: tetratricopeptide repeat protein [Candidatus Eisenbacteria bacterium]|nr:tetratricopeptide repeat protein [Candidatus Eisenbacteria bacterium]
MTERNARARTMWNAALVTLAAILTYANTLGNGFVWTDHREIEDGYAILQSGGEAIHAFSRPLWAFTGTPMPDGGGYYRPFTAISYTIDHALFGGNPAGYHAVNVLLHGAVTLLLFLLLQRLFPVRRVPLLASLLFAVHPIHTEAVAWIGGRPGLLAAAGMLLSLNLYLRSSRKPIWLAGSLAAFLFALGSKESAATLPLLVLLVRRQDRREGEPFLTPWKEPLFFVLLALYLLVRRIALGSLGAGVAGTIEPIYLLPTVLRVLGGYLRLLLLPFPLHTNDAVRLSDFPLDPRAFLALLALSGALFGFIRLGRGRRETGFGLLWMAITILPFLNLIPLLHFRAERMLYLPSVGFLVAVAVLLDLHGGRILGRRERFGMTPGELTTVLLALLLAAGALARNRTWRDDRTLFTDTLAKNEYAPEAMYEFGREAYVHGAYEEALRLTRASLALRPGWAAYLPIPWAWNNVGYAEYKLGRYEDADRAFRESLRLFRGMDKAAFGLALTRSALGRHEEAVELYGALVRRDPEQNDARYNLALEYESLDSLDRAEETYRETIRRDPQRKAAHMNLGSLLARRGAFAEALRFYRNALEIAPMDPVIHYNVGLLFASAGNREGAEKALRNALELDPGYEDAETLLDEILAAGADSAGAGEP